jgi:hypothetical protein
MNQQLGSSAKSFSKLIIQKKNKKQTKKTKQTNKVENQIICIT